MISNGTTKCGNTFSYDGVTKLRADLRLWLDHIGDENDRVPEPHERQRAHCTMRWASRCLRTDKRRNRWTKIDL